MAGKHPAPWGRHFLIDYQVRVVAVPADADTAYLWIPVAPTTVDQTINSVTVEGDLPHTEVIDAKYGNRAWRFPLAPGDPAQTVTLTFDVTRFERVRSTVEKTPGDALMPAADPALWRAGDRLVPIGSQVKQWADEVTAGEPDAIAKARAIFDYAVRELVYDKSGTGWGNGDIFFACDAKHGNCTDFHAVFTGFARAEGIPARFEIGFPVPSDRPAGRIGGYHCWAQFYTDMTGWVPVDASEASKHPQKERYFFGSLDRNRVLFTVGRDITLPGMKATPLNYFIYPYVEVDGEPWLRVERQFSYRDMGSIPS